MKRLSAAFLPSLAIFLYYRLAGMFMICMQVVGFFDPLGLCPNLFGVITVYHWVTLLFVLPALSYYVFFRKPTSEHRVEKWEYYGLIVLWLILIFIVVVFKSALDLPFATVSLR